MIHNVKIDECYYQQIVSGDKTFEVRFNDRGYNKGDILHFNVNGFDELKYKITYVHSGYGLKENFVVLGIKNV